MFEQYQFEAGFDRRRLRLAIIPIYLAILTSCQTGDGGRNNAPGT